jgi:hypothetical protein
MWRKEERGRGEVRKERWQEFQSTRASALGTFTLGIPSSLGLRPSLVFDLDWRLILHK